jgi:hypothetical protein
MRTTDALDAETWYEGDRCVMTMFEDDDRLAIDVQEFSFERPQTYFPPLAIVYLNVLIGEFEGDRCINTPGTEEYAAQVSCDDEATMDDLACPPQPLENLPGEYDHDGKSTVRVTREESVIRFEVAGKGGFSVDLRTGEVVRLERE